MGVPLAFATGHVSDVTDPKTPAQQFFTNSVGRFAIQDLKPGHRYRADINAETAVWFTFETPKQGASALVNLKTVTALMK
jgi:outer membrane usher protein